MNTLYELPLWIGLIPLAAAVGVFVYANNRGITRLKWASLGVALLGPVLAGISYFVDTPRELSVKRTRAIVESVVEQRWEDFRGLLNRNTSVTVVRGPEAISAMLERLTATYGLKSATILGTESVVGSGTIDVTISVFSEHDFGPQRTAWRFEYEQRADGILLSRVSPVQVAGGTNVGNIERQLR